MAKRKSTKILEALSAPPKVDEQPIEIKVDEPLKEPIIVVAETPVACTPEVVVPDAPKKKPKPEKDAYAEELKKMRKFQEDQQNRLEARLEGMITRKFMEVKNMAQPVRNYKPYQHPPVQRVKYARPPPPPPVYYTPDEDEEDDYGDYATQEEDVVEEEPKKSDLFCKIFG